MDVLKTYNGTLIKHRNMLLRKYELIDIEILHLDVYIELRNIRTISLENVTQK